MITALFPLFEPRGHLPRRHLAQTAAKIVGGAAVGVVAAAAIVGGAEISETALEVRGAFEIVHDANSLYKFIRTANDLNTLAADNGGDLTKTSLWNVGPKHVHHMLPQQYEANFRYFDISVDDFTMTVPEWWHRAIHRGVGEGAGGWWNNQWRKFLIEWLIRDAKPTEADVVSYLGKLLRETGVRFIKEIR